MDKVKVGQIRKAKYINILNEFHIALVLVLSHNVKSSLEHQIYPARISKVLNLRTKDVHVVASYELENSKLIEKVEDI